MTASRAPGAHGGGAEEGFLRHGGRGLLLTFYAALRSLKLYPLENATVQKALDDLLAATQHLLAEEVEMMSSQWGFGIDFNPEPEAARFAGKEGQVASEALRMGVELLSTRRRLAIQHD